MPSAPRALVARRLIVILDAIRASPARDSPVVANGICWNCATQPDLPARALDYYHCNVLSDLLEIGLAEAGTA